MLDISQYKVFSRLVLIFGGLLLLVSCKSVFKEKWTQEVAPEYFRARFETTKGNFEIESRRSWSPKAVDRLHQLISHGYYEDMAIFRVIPGYVAQFGIHNDSIVTNSWQNINVVDEHVIEKNLKGTMAFARSTPGTRTTHLFINLENNSPRLDTLEYAGVKGFPVVAKITDGFDVVDAFYKGYGRALDTKQDSITNFGNTYLKEKYPNLDYINKAYILN